MERERTVPLRTTRRTFEILEILAEESVETAELSRRLDLPKSTLYDYLRTLDSLGYVINDGGEYRLAFKALEFGGRRKYHSQLFRLAKPEVERLAEETGEIASVSVEEHGRVVMLHSEIGSESLQLDHYPGSSTPIHTHAGGKVMLAGFSEEKREEILTEHGLAPETEHTITDRDELMAELETIRERGYGIDRDQVIVGVGTIAAPIRVDDRIVGSLTIAFPADRLTADTYRETLVQEIQTSANIVSVNYEHSP